MPAIIATRCVHRLWALTASAKACIVFITREANDLRFAQDLHDNIERNIRLRKVQGARSAVRKLLNHSDEFVRRHLPRKARGA